MPRWRAPASAYLGRELCSGRCTPEPHQDYGRHKVIDHPDVGLITLDCDTLLVAADDLRITIYTAEPESEDAERLALAIVLGTQSLVE